MQKYEKIFVTGADGFIGSHLTERLIECGYTVTALSLYNSFGHHGWLEESLAKKSGRLKIISGDIRDVSFMQKNITGHDAVLHLASLIAIPYSYHAPRSYVETNIAGTLNVMQACLDNNIKRVIHTSTSEVYGSAQTVPITENHPLQGQSPYSASKIGADKIVESFHKSFNLPAVTLRPFNTFGPRQSFRAIIPTIIGQVLSGKEFIRLGDLLPTRDLTFVHDTANAFISVLEAPDDKVVGETFNAGSGKEISIGNLCELIFAILDKPMRIETQAERLRPSKSEVNRLCSDSSKLLQATHWKPQIELKEGLTKVVEWMRKLPKETIEKAFVYQI